jgi:hypothetical protein
MTPNIEDGMQSKDASSEPRNSAAVHDLVRRHPIGAVVGAMGVGFVLGGGLFARTATRFVGAGLLRAGIRVVLPILTKEIVQALTNSKLGSKKGE